MAQESHLRLLLWSEEHDPPDSELEPQEKLEKVYEELQTEDEPPLLKRPV